MTMVGVGMVATTVGVGRVVAAAGLVGNIVAFDELGPAWMMRVVVVGGPVAFDRLDKGWWCNL